MPKLRMILIFTLKMSRVNRKNKMNMVPKIKINSFHSFMNVVGPRILIGQVDGCC